MDATKKKTFISLLMSLIVVLALSFSLIGCASSEPSEEKKQDATTEEAPAAEETEEPEVKEEQKSETKKITESSKSNSESKASSSSSNKSSASSNTSSSSSAATHTHKWVKHDAVYENEPVYEKRVVCSCGNYFTSQAAWESHCKALVKQDPDSGCSYSYKSVQVDTKKVLVEEAYYSCSCGATK